MVEDQLRSVEIAWGTASHSADQLAAQLWVRATDSLHTLGWDSLGFEHMLARTHSILSVSFEMLPTNIIEEREY